MRWNDSPVDEAVARILPCCGSTAWAREMVKLRPFPNEGVLMASSDATWRSLDRADWMEAFRSHPRIGESSAHGPSAQGSEAWAMYEQEQVADAGDAVKIALAEANREYERKFGHIFIVCAMGKSGAGMLEILQHRLHNDAETELQEAAEQQRQIMQIRLTKWLQG
jgi:2-oxo-4-hydroxy-4-carboxy-5-ureidoimidazoline decarboxylase